MSPRKKTKFQYCDKCSAYQSFEQDKKVVKVGRDGMICAVWIGLSCKICGFETAGIIYKKGHPAFDELMVEIDETPT